MVGRFAQQAPGGAKAAASGGQEESASPATGMTIHRQEQQELTRAALGDR
jgi:hypothetical protein